MLGEEDISRVETPIYGLLFFPSVNAPLFCG